MALQIALPRALDTLGDIVPLATAYFFEAGSTAPLVVYEDKNLNTSRGTTVNADANGVFPQCWAANSKAVKVDIQNGDGLSLPGYPQDNHGTYPDSQGAAASLSFAPYSPNASTNVQAAIEGNVDRINVAENSTRIAVATGSGGSYAITSGNTIPAYAVGQEFEFIANHTNVGGGGDTLNVDAVGGSIIKKYDAALAKVDLAADEIIAGMPVRVKYDGVNLVMASPIAASEDFAGLVEAATTEETTAGTADKYPDAAKIAALIGAKRSELASLSTATGNEADFTIASGARRVIVTLRGVRTDGTDSLLLQLGDAGGVEVAGYEGGSSHSAGDSNSANGWTVIRTLATDAVFAQITLNLVDEAANGWSQQHGGERNGSSAISGGGYKELSAELTTIRISANGNTFDSGSAIAVVEF